MIERPFSKNFPFSKEDALTAIQDKKLLSGYGIPVLKEAFAESSEEAVSLAEEFGYPVDLKGVGALPTQKNGLMHTGILDADSMRCVCRSIQKKAEKTWEGFIVRKTPTGTRQLKAGFFRDRQLGLVVYLGLGGLQGKVLPDITYRVFPFNEIDASDMLDEIRGKSIFGPFEEEDSVHREKLIEILMTFSKIGVAHPEVSSIGIDPLIITYDGNLLAVDAILKRHATPCELDMPLPVPSNDVMAFFHPRSIALIGVSSRFGKWGYMIMINLISGGFNGRIFFVNPHTDTIAGRPVYKSVSDIPEEVDLAVITTPASTLPGLIPQLKEKGIKRMIVLAAGFGDPGTNGTITEKELLKQAREADIRIIGTNTMGISNPSLNFNCTGVSIHADPGGVSIISQSNNMGLQLLSKAKEKGVGVRAFCGTGSETMISTEDLLEAFGNDPETDALMIYMEFLKNPKRFFECAKRVSRKKPIILYRGRQGDAASKTTGDQTGTVTETPALFDAACRQAGVIRADRSEELIDLNAAFSSLPLPEGNRVAILCMGGGGGRIAADMCRKYGLEVPKFSKTMVEKIGGILTPYWNGMNPVERVCENDMTMILKTTEELVAWEGCDAIIVLGIKGRGILYHYIAGAVDKTEQNCPPEFVRIIEDSMVRFEEEYIEHIVKLMEKYRKPIIGVSVLSDRSNKNVYRLKGERYSGVFFSTPERSAKSLACMYGYRRFLEK